MFRYSSGTSRPISAEVWLAIVTHNIVASDNEKIFRNQLWTIHSLSIRMSVQPVLGCFGHNVRSRSHCPAFECITQTEPERIRIQKAFDFAMVSKRDGAGLFRNNNRDGIRLFRHPDRRSMPRAKILTQPWFHRQRQETGGCGNPVVLDDNGSIV